MKSVLSYESILATDWIKKHYDKIDLGNNDGNWHGTHHINSVIKIVKKLFSIIEIDNEIKDAVLIAVALHDIGKDYSNNRKVDDHAELGRKIAEKFLAGYDIKYKNEILNAIALHEVSNSKHDLIGCIVCLCDKLDIAAARLVRPEHSLIYDITFSKQGNKLILTYIVAKNFDIKYLDEDNYVLRGKKTF